MIKYEIDEENLVSLYNSGADIKTISKILEAPYKVVWRRLKKLGIETKRKTRKVNNDIFSQYNKDTCYWAGFIAADGFIRKDSPYLGIELAYKDINHILKFKNFVESDAEIKTRERLLKSGNTSKYCGILIYSHKIKKELREKFNIVPKKAKVIKPPVNIPDKFIKDFIRGNFDGDGSISWNKSNNKPRIQFSSSSYYFIEWIKNSIKGNITEEIGNPKIGQNKMWKTYLLEYTGKQVIPIMTWLYGNNFNDFCLNRKLKRFMLYKEKLDVMEKQRLKVKKDRINRNKNIIMLRNSGLTYDQIALKVGVCPATCYNVIRKHTESNA
jgi:hypothetical protein